MLYGGLAWPGLAAVRGARCAVAGLSIEQLDNADSRSMFLGRWVLGVFLFVVVVVFWCPVMPMRKNSPGELQFSEFFAQTHQVTGLESRLLVERATTK